MPQVAAKLIAAEPSCDVPIAPASDEHFRRRTVLLVDDDTDVLMLLGETMTGLGHRVIKAQDGRAALECLLKYSAIDCIFSDVVMPHGMNGVQFAAAARAIRPNLPVLLASCYSFESIRRLGAIPEGVDFIAKPYTLTDLFALLDRPRAVPGPCRTVDRRGMRRRAALLPEDTGVVTSLPAPHAADKFNLHD
jgi:CheY-like chemotaxis protein